MVEPFYPVSLYLIKVISLFETCLFQNTVNYNTVQTNCHHCIFENIAYEQLVPAYMPHNTLYMD